MLGWFFMKHESEPLKSAKKVGRASRSRPPNFANRPRGDIHNVYVLLVATVINREAISCWSIKAICLVGVSDKHNLAIKKIFQYFSLKISIVMIRWNGYEIAIAIYCLICERDLFLKKKFWPSQDSAVSIFTTDYSRNKRDFFVIYSPSVVEKRVDLPFMKWRRWLIMVWFIIEK